MKKKELNTSTSNGRKKFLKITFTNKKKNLQLKQKQRLNKSMDKKKNIGIYLPTEPSKFIIEERNQNNRIHLTKQRKDKNNINSSSYIKSRSIKSNKVKEYENTLNKLNEDSTNEREREKEKEKEREKEKEKDFDFLYFKFNKEGGKQRSNTYKQENDMMYKRNIKSSKINNSKNPKKKDESKENLYESKNKKDEDSSDDDMRNEDDILYRTLYRPSLTKKTMLFLNYKKEKDKELSDSKEKTVSHPTSQLILSSNNPNEKKSSLSNNDKNNSRSNYKLESDDSKDFRRKIDSNNDSKIYYSKSFGYLSNERTIDLYIIDTDGEEPNVSGRNRRKINRRRNIVKEIKIEKFDKFHPVRNEKLTGFVLIRKSNGKRVYDIELEDNIDEINEILKNKEIKIKNEIFQFITLQQLNNYEQEIKYYKGKISRLQSDLKQMDLSLEKSGNKDKDLEKEKDDQISALKAKIEELNKIIFNQQEELDHNIREFKQVKLAYDLLQDSIEKEKNGKEPTPEQVYKLKKAQIQIEEKNDQKTIKEMKIRIRKYKDELKKEPTNENSRRVSKASMHNDDPNLKDIKTPRKKQMVSKDIKELKENENPVNPQADASDDDDKIELYNLGEDKDPRKRKLKNAVNRFKTKYQDVIKEERKLKKQKEKEEREREENEEKELEDENYENQEDYLKEQKEREERERREKEEKERKERERKEKEEKERREREERERKEREERERKEKEERERREREEMEERERERETKEREERERREREEKEKERKERKKREDKEKKEREEKERKKKEKKIKEEELRKQNEKKEKGTRPGQNKMMGGNFAKMLANKLKAAPPGGKKVGSANKNSVIPKPPIIERNVDMAELLVNQPFKERKGRKKPAKIIFVEEE